MRNALDLDLKKLQACAFDRADWAEEVLRRYHAAAPKLADGAHKGKHVLYEGAEKAKYECKHCGASASSISILTGSSCSRHSLGTHKGRHEPVM